MTKYSFQNDPYKSTAPINAPTSSMRKGVKNPLQTHLKSVSNAKSYLWLADLKNIVMRHVRLSLLNHRDGLAKNPFMKGAKAPYGGRHFNYEKIYMPGM